MRRAISRRVDARAEYLTAAEVMGLLQVTRNTLRSLRLPDQHGVVRLPTYTLRGSRCLRFLQADVRALLEPQPSPRRLKAV
jgi:hypothetical protein